MRCIWVYFTKQISTQKVTGTFDIVEKSEYMLVCCFTSLESFAIWCKYLVLLYPFIHLEIEECDIMILHVNCVGINNLCPKWVEFSISYGSARILSSMRRSLLVEFAAKHNHCFAHLSYCIHTNLTLNLPRDPFTSLYLPQNIPRWFRRKMGRWDSITKSKRYLPT